MTRFSRALRGSVATLWLAAGGASFAAAPAVTDEMLAPLASAYVQAVKPGEQADIHRDLIDVVLRRVERSYALEVDVPALVSTAVKAIEPVPPQSGEPAAVFKTAMNAALSSLDPHSRYLDARAQSNQRNALMGTFGGVGVRVEMVDGLVRVLEPTPDAPAARAGLQAGDLIVRFDDQPVLGMTLAEASSKMRGAAGSPLTMTIRRAGAVDEFNVTLVREIIRVQPLRWSMEGDVLVLRLATFTATAASLLDKAITEATAVATPRAVVLDMRGNGGGLLRQAVTIADTFLSEGNIVSLRGRTPGNRMSWQADPAEQLAGVPMVVLVDGRSASAAELVAAALQENGRAVVMGQRSFGKGSVQSMISLGGEKGGLRLTTALYHGPSGRTVQRTGVGPDIELVAEAQTPAPTRREADRAQALAGKDEPPPPKLRVEQSRCALPRQDFDPGLACALAFVRSGGIDPFVAALDPAEQPSTR